jgi:ankyrin repeat protein/uncharacterized protein YegJ (DUF2314 family)
MSIFKKLFGSRTPDERLIHAVENGDVAAATAALDDQANIEAADKRGCTILMTAVYGQNQPMVEMLLERGANPNEAGDGTPVLHFAALTGNVAILDLLLQRGADITAKDRIRGCSSMLPAVVKGNAEAVTRLIQAGLSPNEATDQAGSPMIFEAVERDHGAVIKALVAGGADPNYKRADQVTPVIAAAFDGKLEALQALLGAGADPSAEYKRGLSAAMVAEARGHKEAARLLFEASGQRADPFFKAFPSEDAMLARVKELADRDMPQFLSWWEDPAQRAGRTFAVKCAVEDEHGVEHIWMIVQQREGEMLVGRIDNDLATVKSLKCGDAHRVAISDVEDLMVTNATCAVLLGGHHMRATGVIE